MSYTEHHMGKLKRVDLTEYDNDINKFFKHLCKEIHPTWSDEDFEEDIKHYEKQGSSDPWVTMWFDETGDYEKYILVNNEVWSVEDQNIDEDEGMLVKLSDNEYQYYTSFYNGGTCLSEQLECLLKFQLQKN